METVYLKSTAELRRNLSEIQEKLKVKITLYGKKAVIEGPAFEEYEASLVLDAIGLGFTAKRALTIQEENTVFRKIPIKNFTRRKNLSEVRARIIGKEGKTKKTIDEISGCSLVLSENTVGLIGPAESIDEATTALTNLIRGSKQANVYRFLERMNSVEKTSDLGLKTSERKTIQK